MRFPYTFAVPKFGGRNWTIVSALLLFVADQLALIYFVQQPDTPFWLMALAAATAGSVAATSHPAWRTSRSSSPTRRRASRSA